MYVNLPFLPSHSKLITLCLGSQHKKDEIKGYLFKMAKEVKFFSFALYYKRFFLLSMKQQVFLIQNEEVSKKVIRIPFAQILFIDGITDHRDKKHEVTCEWKFSFSIQTKDRKYFLFARSEEEQFLWLSSFYRMAKVQVVDMKYEPPASIKKMYAHRTTGFHYRIRDPDSSSGIDLSSMR